MTADELLARLEKVKVVGDGWTARCPAHDDGRSSLSVGRGDDGRILLHCHAGCETSAVVEALGLKMADLMPDVTEAEKQRARPQIVATYDYTDAEGALVYQVCRKSDKSFLQRRPDERGGWAWSLKGVDRVPYRLPELVASGVGAPVFVAEGEKDCDRLASLGLVATTNAGGAGVKWPKRWGAYFRGRTVVVLADNDDPGREHAVQVAGMLRGAGVTVKALELEGLPPKGDVSDWLDAGHGKEELLGLVAAAPVWSPEAARRPVGGDEPAGCEERNELSVAQDAAPRKSSSSRGGEDARPVFCHEPGDLGRSHRYALRQLAKHPDVYQRGTELVSVARWDQEQRVGETLRRPLGGAITAPIADPVLRIHLADCVMWCKFDARSKRDIPCPPPADVVSSIARLKRWPRSVRVLEGLTTVPILRPDGRVWALPGYDKETGIFADLEGPPIVIPRSPTHGDATAAMELLLDVVGDFPFSEPAGRHGWVALVLTQLARHMMDISRGFVFDAPVSRSGKTKLATLAGIIATGRPLAAVSYTEHNDEMDKRLFTFMREGRSQILIDNCPNGGAIGWPCLDQYLTAPVIVGRVLGESRSGGELRNNSVVVFTGNNLATVSDLGTRVLRIRLEPLEEHPEDRTCFKRPGSELDDYVTENRSRLVGAALTMLSAYLRAGKPCSKEVSSADFSAWHDLVCGPIVWCGGENPASLLASKSDAANPADDALRMFLEAMVKYDGETLDPNGAGKVYPDGLTVKDMLSRTASEREYAADPELMDALCEFISARAVEKKDGREIGDTLRKSKGRAVSLDDGRTVRLATPPRSPKSKVSMCWYVETIAGGRVEPRGSVGSQGHLGSSVDYAGEVSVDSFNRGWTDDPTRPYDPIDEYRGRGKDEISF